MSKLVVVESPAKARTIEQYLPDEYVVRASMGHVRDLPDNARQLPAKYKKEPWARLGVNVENGFEPVYVTKKDKRSKQTLGELKKLLQKADELILATDEDREGEAISWHLVEILQPDVPVKRMVFHEITKTAIREALDNTRDIDQNLVEAQEARRILDRLVGYPLSLLVTKKIRHGLSAGRVQSVAVRMLVDRELERRRFRKGSYWSLKAELEKSKSPFEATLHRLDGTRLATGKDFDEHTGKIAEGREVLLLDEDRARKLAADLVSASFNVSDVVTRQYQTSPKAPFITSTLQQEASRKLRMSAKQTMSTAQRLYENGFITYMRTDSTHLSGQAISAARKAAGKLYGPAYVPGKPRIYKSKSKGAQEAHEAIRPTGDRFQHPSKTGLSGNEAALYDLIWRRTVACQMTNARRTSIRVDLEAEACGSTCLFRANGNRIDFPGYLRAYVEGSDDPEAALEDKESFLPEMKRGDGIDCRGVTPNGHETKPPARYTEASLVKALEEAGVGRPSTYATILDKITQDDRYARKSGSMLIPTYAALAVTNLLKDRFPELVDLTFTAQMEDDLDRIADGEASKAEYLHEFYRKEGAFADQIERNEKEIKPAEARKIDLEDFDATLRIGRYGPYVQLKEKAQKGKRQNLNVPDDVAPADLKLEELLEEAETQLQEDKELGEHPETGQVVLLKQGPYGPYVQLGPNPTDDDAKKKRKKKPKRSSLPKGTSLSDVDLDFAIRLLSLPRDLGKHPDDGKKVQAGLGRYGPYVRHNKEYRSLADMNALFSCTLEEALELLAQPKGRRKRRVIKEVGKHPGSGKEIKLLDGRYGPYIKVGRTNVSLPRGVSPEDVSLDTAVKLIEAKKSKKKARK